MQETVVRQKCTGQISFKVGLVLRVIRQPAAVSPFSACLSWSSLRNQTVCGGPRWGQRPGHLVHQGMGRLCSRALQGLAEAVSGTVLLFSCSLCSMLHPSPPHTATVLLPLSSSSMSASGKPACDKERTEMICKRLQCPSFSLKTSQQIAQPAQSSGGVNDGKRDIYPCLLPGSTFSLPCRKGLCVFSFLTSYLRSEDYCRFSLFCILF